MTPAQAMERLKRDKPLFHYADEDVIRRAAKGGYHFQPGDLSMAVSPGVLKWIAGHVTDSMMTIETGAGYSTVLLAAISKHHYCCTIHAREIDRISQYVTELGIPLSKITFLHGSTDQTLPNLDRSQLFDFAYIDGCHGYPFPALDWHYIDLRLRIGGLLGMDNVELRPVREHCDFLEENGTYELVGKVTEGYFVRFYRKLADDQREWVDQDYSRAKKEPCDQKLSTRVRRRLTKLLKPHLF